MVYVKKEKQNTSYEVRANQLVDLALSNWRGETPVDLRPSGPIPNYKLFSPEKDIGALVLAGALIKTINSRTENQLQPYFHSLVYRGVPFYANTKNRILLDLEKKL